VHGFLRAEVRQQLTWHGDEAFAILYVAELGDVLGIGDSLTLDEVFAGVEVLVERGTAVVAGVGADHAESSGHAASPWCSG
jgi:hypothetical protein